MQFSLSEEQQMLADTLAHWTRTSYAFDVRRELAQREMLSEDNWNQLAELGVLGLNIPETYGGLGGTPIETLIVMQAFGRALVVEPFVQTAVVCAALIRIAGTAAQREEILPAIVEGSRRVALAALEPASRFDLSHVATTAVQNGDAYILNGRKAVVLAGDSAHTLIVSARTSGSTNEEAGISLFLLDSTASGLQRRGCATVDGLRAAEITLADVTVSRAALLGEFGGGFKALDWAVDQGIAALCAEAVGAMESLMELTADYIRTRKQFGQSIGKFQAIQHRAADMAIAIEQSRAATLLAAAHAGLPAMAERRPAISAAKTIVGQAARLAGEIAIQLHGGMGMTDELAIGYYFKRLTCIDMTWGNAEFHIDRYGKLL